MCGLPAIRKLINKNFDLRKRWYKLVFGCFFTNCKFFQPLFFICNLDSTNNTQFMKWPVSRNSTKKNVILINHSKVVLMSYEKKQLRHFKEFNLGLHNTTMSHSFKT